MSTAISRDDDRIPCVRLTHAERHKQQRNFCLSLSRIAKRGGEHFEARTYLTYARQHENMRQRHMRNGS